MQLYYADCDGDCVAAYSYAGFGERFRPIPLYYARPLEEPIINRWGFREQIWWCIEIPEAIAAWYQKTDFYWIPTSALHAFAPQPGVMEGL